MGQKKDIPTNGVLLKEINQALNKIGKWGSIEIYVQDGKVTQITSRTIKKTEHIVKLASQLE